MVAPKKLAYALAIRKLARILNDHNIKYVFIGSTSLWLWGIWKTPGDIDLLTDEQGIGKLAEIFSKAHVIGPVYRETREGKSLYLKFYVYTIPVEVMADFIFHGENISKRLKNRKKVRRFALTVFLTPPEVSLESYKKGVRKKDLEKARAIEKWLSEQNLANSTISAST